MQIIVVAALYMAVGVGSGAFGAHALKESISPADMAIWEKAVFYHLVHSLAALVLVSMPRLGLTERLAASIAWLLLGSVAIFSGSLYLLVLSGYRWLGMITPLGGLGFMASWLLVAFAAWRFKKSRSVS